VTLAGSPSWLGEDLARVERLLIRTVSESKHPPVKEPSSHLLRAGGKRLRPALVMLTARSGRSPTRAGELAAGAIELVHLATLYHDDVIDGTGTRRGVPTAHSKWGTEIAVLAGDYLFARACWLGAIAGGDVPAILARAISQVCEGQILETGSLGDPDRTVDDYLETIRLKTAALFRASCELGAATSGADGATRAALLRYGENLGLAFQMVDDLLDIVGDPGVTGKVPGTDLRGGVFTAPILIASGRDSLLSERLSSGSRDLEEVMPFLETTRALDEVFELAAAYGRQAYDALERLPEADWTAVLRATVEGVLAQVRRPSAA
jgi:geranylgeranyl pyrophosphate synthase